MDSCPHLFQEDMVGTMIGPCKLILGAQGESGLFYLLTQVWIPPRHLMQSGESQQDLN